MSGWLWTLIITVAIGIVLATIGWITEARHHDEEWVAAALADAAKKGLPPATHRKRRLLRTVGLKSIDPTTGEVLWRIER